MKQVFLIRHAQPAFPGNSKMCIGITDIPIGDLGKQQAQHMAAKLLPVTAVFSSPLRRAVQTAQAIGQPVTILPGLREMAVGEWDGLTFDQIRERYPELYAARARDMTIPLPSAEDTHVCLSRFCAAMELAAREAPGDFAVVAHGGIIAQFLQKITGIWRKPDYAQYDLQAAVTEYYKLFYSCELTEEMYRNLLMHALP